MARLNEEYTDIRGRTHKVEHIVIPAEDGTAMEQLMEDLFHALTKTGKTASADHAGRR